MPQNTKQRLFTFKDYCEVYNQMDILTWVPEIMNKYIEYLNKKLVSVTYLYMLNSVPSR